MLRTALLVVALCMVGCAETPAPASDVAAAPFTGKVTPRRPANDPHDSVAATADIPDPNGHCAQLIPAGPATGCGDQDLALLDQRLVRAYRRALAQSDQPEAERSKQWRWLRGRRDACAQDSDCLRRVYLQQLRYFEGSPRYAHSADAQ